MFCIEKEKVKSEWEIEVKIESESEKSNIGFDEVKKIKLIQIY